MRLLIVTLVLCVNCGCNIPIHSVTPTSYAKGWVERELDDLLPIDASHEEVRSILKENGYDDALLISREAEGSSRTELVASKRRNGDEIIRVTMPVSEGHVTKPFRIEWVESASGTVTMSETTDP